MKDWRAYFSVLNNKYQYDGSGKLGTAIANLCGLSPKSHAQIAELIKQAKDGLSITSKAKILPTAVKLGIFRWHYDRLNSAQPVKQGNDNKLKLLLHNIVQDIKQESPVQIDDDIDVSVYDFKQIHFAITITHDGKPKRTTVMLEGNLVKALQHKHGLADNTAIRAWIEQAIKVAGGKFDSYVPLTKQVKRLIVESFV